MKRLLLIIVAFLIFSTACYVESENIKQDKIYLIYTVEYGNNQTYITAKFKKKKEDGRTILLSDGASIKFNDENLRYRLIGTFYDTYISGFPTNGEFVYTDLDGNIYTNNIGEIPDSINFDESENYIIDKNEDKIFVWKGNPIAENECISSSITKDVKNCAVNTTELVIPQSYLQELKDSTISSSSDTILHTGRKINLSREFTEELQSAPIGGKLIKIYNSSSKTFDIEE